MLSRVATSVWVICQARRPAAMVRSNSSQRQWPQRAPKRGSSSMSGLGDGATFRARWYDESGARVKPDRVKQKMLPINDAITIPEDELSFSYARSGGPGGQNVNKVSSKAILRWELADSAAVSPEVKERIGRTEKKRVTT